MKKFLSILMILTLALSMGTMAFADETTTEKTYTVTINNATGHTYKIYQIFTGDLATDENGNEILSNVKYGENYGTKGEAVPANELENLDPNSIAPTGTGKDMTVADGKATATGLIAGYYMIKDETADLPAGDTPSAVIFQVVGDTEVTSKHSTTPTTEKKVDDINDSNGTETEIEWHDSADHDIGDLIDFQLSAVIPNSIAAFVEAKQAYPFIFHDQESVGLKFKEIKEVYILNGTEKTTLDASSYSVVTTDLTDGCSFEVRFTDLTKIAAVKGGSKLIVEYKSELTKDAVIGSAGNPNKMCGEFRNLGTPETPAFTPWDTVIVFTFKADVNKVDQAQKPLTGAEFKLEKFVANAEGTETYKGVKGDWATLTLVKNDAGTVFSFTGLDDGEYRISETVTPAGYNTVDPIYFTVTAEHTVKAANPELENLQATVVKSDGTAYTEEEIKNGNIASFTVTNAEGEVSTTVVNNKGVELPETGGVGTTLFYIFGGCLVLGAIVLMITKKRMKNAEE